MKKVCHFLLNLLRQHTILIFFRNLLSRILRNSKVFLRVYPTVKLSKKEFEVVIAQYNEDIRWSDALKDNRTVYNKGVRLDCPYAIKLPNVGREAHTYLWHIVNNYKRLANITLFTQGSIEENSFNFEWIRREPAWRGKSVLDTVLSCRLLSRTISIAMPFFEYGVKGIDKSGKIQFAGKWLEELKTGHMMNSEYDFINWINKYVFNKHRYGLEDINWIPHSVFYVHKDLILANSKEYYENLLATVSDHINPMEGHYFERAWFHIFTRNYYYKISIILICDTSSEALTQSYIANIKEALKYPNVEIILFHRSSEEFSDERLQNDFSGYINKGKIRYYSFGNTEFLQVPNELINAGFTAMGEIVTWINSNTSLSSSTLFNMNNEFIVNKNILIQLQQKKTNESGQLYVRKDHLNKINISPHDLFTEDWFNISEFVKEICSKNELEFRLITQKDC